MSTLLLLHAGGLDARMWGPLIERLGGEHRVIAPDLRQTGRDAEEVAALLDGPAVAVGASYGGMVALQLATLAPQRVAALGLFAATLPDHQYSPALHAFFAEEDALLQAGDVEGAVALGLREWPTEEPELVAAMVRDRLAGDPAELGPGPAIDLAAIGVPTLAVSGGRDHADFAVMADRIAAEVPGARRAEVGDAGHLIALDRPDAAAALLRPLLA